MIFFRLFFNGRLFPRHISAAVHFNFNLHRDIKQQEADGVERVKVSYPKFKNGEATVRNVSITQNFSECTVVLADCNQLIRKLP